VKGQRETLTAILLLVCAACLFSSSGCGGGSGGTGGPPPPPPNQNPVPAIASLAPGAATAGGAAFAVTISGYNFLPSSAVQWNGSARASTFVSGTQLQAQITAADIVSAGSAMLSVTNPAPGGGNSGPAEFTINPILFPAPTVLSLIPASANAGSPALILTINGSSFLPGSIVEWNGATLTTSFLSDTQLEVQVPSSYLANPGIAAVAVLNPSPGGGLSTPQAFSINYQPLVLNQLANDLVWDATHQLIYLSIPSLASSNGNTVASLNPVTGNIQATQFAGSEPDVLAISNDNQFLYAALDGSSAVQRFTLPSLTPDITYSLGADPSYGPYFGLDLQVAPGLPRTTAVSRAVFPVSPYAQGGIAIQDDANQRAHIAWTTGDLYDSMQWASNSTIYAINNEIASFDLYGLTVNSTGVTLSSDHQQAFAGFYVRMHYDPGTRLVYTDDGSVINPASGQRVAAFQASGYMVPDSGLNRAFFLGQTQSQAGTPSFTIESLDLTSLAPIAEIVVPYVRGFPLHFIRWGSSGLAFNDDAGFIYVINDNAFVSAAVHGTATGPQALKSVSGTWTNTRPAQRLRAMSQTRSMALRPRSPVMAAAQSNPAPSATSLNPNFVAEGQVGINGLTLTVSGSNFVSLSTVEWNGTPRKTDFVSNSELQAQINFADVLNAGSASVSVTTPTPGGGTSNALTSTIAPQPMVHIQSLNGLFPDSAAAGSGAISLQVSGIWISSGDTVLWNGSPRPTSSTGALQAQISAADLATPGLAQVSVLTPDGTVTNALQFQVLYQPTVVNQATNHMIWDPMNRLLYFTVPSSATTRSSQVCALDPVTGSIPNCQTGSEPNRLAISDDSRFLYVGMDGANSIQRFALPGLIPDINYSLASAGVSYYALDLQVAPGAAHTLAVTKGTVTDPKATGGITIYDDAIARPVALPGWGPSSNLFDSLQWGADATKLYAASSEGNGDFYTLSADSSGVTLDQDYPEIFWNPGGIHYNKGNGLIYSDDGFHVIDPSTGLPVGIFELGAGAPMAPDSTLGTVFLLAKYLFQENSNYTIDLFDITHFVKTGAIPFTTTAQLGFNPPTSILRWGSDGLALGFQGDSIYLFSGTVITGQSAIGNQKAKRHVLHEFKPRSHPNLR